MQHFTLLGVSCSHFPKNGQNMSLLWPKHGPSNWFFLNLNQYAQGCPMPNFTLLSERPGAQLKIALDTFRYTTEEAATESLITIKASQNL